MGFAQLIKSIVEFIIPLFLGFFLSSYVWGKAAFLTLHFAEEYEALFFQSFFFFFFVKLAQCFIFVVLVKL